LGDMRYRLLINVATVPMLWQAFRAFRAADFRRDNENLLD